MSPLRIDHLFLPEVRTGVHRHHRLSSFSGWFQHRYRIEIPPFVVVVVAAAAAPAAGTKPAPDLSGRRTVVQVDP